MEVRKVISFENVSKFILNHASIHIPKGCSVGIVGASGAGKTTFLRLACGMLQSEAGKVYVDNRCQRDYSAGMSKEVGVLFTDKPMLDGEESVLGNFETLRVIYRMTLAEYEAAYQELASRLGFDKFEQEKVKNLSLGQRRRAELGAVFLHNPKLILLDEPTNGLDENAKNIFRDMIKERTAAGATAVVSSHDLPGISQICQRIAVLHNGAFVYYGREELLLKRFVPIDVMQLKLKDRIPDLEDLPLEKYTLEDDILTLMYNSNHITAAEILRNLVPQAPVLEVKITKPDLADAICRIINVITPEE